MAGTAVAAPQHRTCGAGGEVQEGGAVEIVVEDGLGLDVVVRRVEEEDVVFARLLPHQTKAAWHWTASRAMRVATVVLAWG
jgi:hypothetical protein